MEKRKVGVVGATGMVGQRFVTLLADHPWFEITAVAASARSAGKTYGDAVAGRWAMPTALPEHIAAMTVLDAADVNKVSDLVDFIVCAVDMDKAATKALEEAYAKAETPVVSNNSAHRMTADVPMILPEVNPEHSDIIPSQKKRLGTKRGFIAVKPNCSIQSYVPILHALRDFGIEKVSVCTYQAISGAGKTFETWPEMVDNVIPYIGGEEEKSEQEPLKAWGKIEHDIIVPASNITISAQCIRVAAQDGHLAACSVAFARRPEKEEMLERWKTFRALPQQLGLPSAPKQLLNYFEEDNRPQTRLDRDLEGGMAISIGRLRTDSIFDYRFIGLSHNTLRGAAGGAVLSAELLTALGYIEKK